ncbi:MAG: response regulator, partial [Alphaproteobacteria bacterium]|nr:response regulator [Alphaproteobacteria bacterium]
MQGVEPRQGPDWGERLTAFGVQVGVTFVASVITLALARIAALPDLTVWFTNIVAILLIVSRGRALYWWSLAGAGLGIFLGVWTAVFTPDKALGASLVNLVDVGLTSALLMRFVGRWPWTQRELRWGMLICLTGGLVLSVIPGSLVLSTALGMPLSYAAYSWYTARAVSVLFIVPAAWSLSNLGREEPAKRWHAPALWVSTVGLTLAVFLLHLPPLIFLPIVPLTWFGMLNLPRQGTYAMLVVAMISVVATQAGYGPLHLIPTDDPTRRILVLQAYLLTLGLIVLPTTQHDSVVRTTMRSLEASEQRATDASRAKSDFLATMSHELRTPIAGVVGFVELLQDTPLTPSQGRYVERIRTAVEHLQVVIGDVLDLSRIEAGGLTLTPEVLDLHELVHACVGLIGGQVSDRVSVTAVIDPAVPRFVDIDGGRLRQVLMNLLSNAAKFTDAGAIIVQISPEDTRPGGYRLLVRDSGCGIPEEDLDRVLGRFTQSGDSLTRSHGGAGLGLPIAKLLVEAMGGELTLRSTVGLGTVVEVHIELVESVGQEALALEPARIGRRAALGFYVLLVDDDPILNELVTVQLEQLGCRVLSVLDPKEAEQLALTEPIDVLISDLHMPELDGFGLLRRVRRLRPKLPALLMTADATLRARQIARVAGFQQILVKPVTLSLLHEVLADTASMDMEAGGESNLVDV